MPLPTLIPAVHASIWAALGAWVAKASAFFRVTAESTVQSLRQAYLAADRFERIDMRIALDDAEFLVRRLLVAAALALRLDPPQRRHPDAAASGRDMPPPSPRRSGPADDDSAQDIRCALSNHAAWLRKARADVPVPWNVEDEAGDFAHRFLAFARLVANPDAVIMALAKRFIGNARQAVADVVSWDRDVRDALSSFLWNNEFNATDTSVLDELEGFRIHAEPG